MGMSGSLKAIRYHRGNNREVSTVTLRYEIRISAGDKYWIFLQGGPTGYEAIPFDEIPNVVSRQVPWAANFGSFTYDKLDVSWEELKKVWDAHPELHPGVESFELLSTPRIERKQ